MGAGPGDLASFFQFIAGLVGAQAQREAGEAASNYYQAKQVQAEQEAESTIQWAQYNEKQQRREDKLKRSRLKVGYLKSGVQVTPGTTPALVIEEQEVQDEMAALSIRAKGITDAARLRSQASFFRVAGRGALDEARFGAISSIIVGSAQAATTQQKLDGPSPSAGVKVKE